MSPELSSDFDSRVLPAVSFPEAHHGQVPSALLPNDPPVPAGSTLVGAGQPDVDGLDSNQTGKRSITSKGTNRRKSKTAAAAAVPPSDIRKRGRPRVDRVDESAGERRRTQIRLAQRAYRSRKESAISSLSGRVALLELTIEKITGAFLAFNDELVNSGVLSSHPLIAHQLSTVTRQILVLTKSSEDPENATQPDGSQDDEMDHSPLPVAQQEIQPYRIEAHDVPVAPTQSPAYGEGFDFGIGLLPVNKNQSPMTMPTNSSTSCPPADDLDFLLFDRPVQPGIGTQADHVSSYSAPSVPTSSPRLLGGQDVRFTYSFQETNFARRLQRRCIENAYAFLSHPGTSPEYLNRKFRFTFGFTSRSRLAGAFQHLAKRDVGESLEFWEKPFFSIGRAGMHYPREDESGNIIFPPNMHPPERAFGPLPFHMAEKPDRFHSKTVDEVIDSIGYGGDWFDCNDVEGYLSARGIHLDSRSTFVVIPSSALPTSDEATAPNPNTTFPSTTSPVFSRPSMSSYDPSAAIPDFNLTPEGINFSSNENDIGSQPFEFFGLHPQPFDGGGTVQLPHTPSSSSNHSPPSDPGSRILDVDRFISGELSSRRFSPPVIIA
ncbi:hypothetical protein FQN57_000803 [Myotisia sp. PD_48]|nr:hypothetical protein FQN57_000803 [Myotisia sp. PD_48]